MKNLFTPENSTLLLIDHQVGTMGWVGSISFDEMKKHALMLAKTAAATGIPTVLTSSMEDQAQGPLLSELKDILPTEFENRILRAGIVNAMTDPNFAKAVEATGRKKIIVAGVTNDVCTVYPVITLIEQGYEVQVVADAGGSPSKFADEMAIIRMREAGAVITSTNQLIAELAQDWSTENGAKLLGVIVEGFQS